MIGWHSLDSFAYKNRVSNWIILFKIQMCIKTISNSVLLVFILDNIMIAFIIFSRKIIQITYIV